MSPIVDLRWPLLDATQIPLDHQYLLFSALSNLIPGLHANTTLGIHPMRGKRLCPGVLQLIESSALRIRTCVEGIAPLLSLSGRVLRLGRYQVRLGVPQVHGLMPSSCLWSRLVTIKGFQCPDTFAPAMRRQLDKMGVGDSVETCVEKRQVVRIRQQTIVGFQVVLRHLSDAESLIVQAVGVGGRRHLGCGLFMPLSSNKGAA